MSMEEEAADEQNDVQIPPPRLNIFQMDHSELQRLHHTLWSSKRRPNNGQLSARTLRIRATEWLLLNGLSTLHRFEKKIPEIRKGGEGRIEEENGECTNAGIAEEKQEEIELDNMEEECNTCRQFRVGKAIPIYEELARMRRKKENECEVDYASKMEDIQPDLIAEYSKNNAADGSAGTTAENRVNGNAGMESATTQYATSWENSGFTATIRTSTANSQGNLLPLNTNGIAHSGSHLSAKRIPRRPFLLNCLCCQRG